RRSERATASAPPTVAACAARNALLGNRRLAVQPRPVAWASDPEPSLAPLPIYGRAAAIPGQRRPPVGKDPQWWIRCPPRMIRLPRPASCPHPAQETRYERV